MNATNMLGFSPLHWAAGNGHRAMVSLLLERGADRRVTSVTGVTPRAHATAKGHEGIAVLLR